MRKYAKKIVSNPLFSGSAVMVFGSNIANAFAYLYHFIIGRLLPSTEYGEMGAILSLLGILLVLVSFLGLVIVKFVSSSKEEDLHGVFSWFYNVGSKFGIVGGIVIFALSPLISKFLHIDLISISLVGPIFLISTHSFILKSFLQGMLRFDGVVLGVNIEIILRLLLGAMLILLGFSVFGAVVGYLIASGISYLFMRRYIKKFKFHKANNFFNNNRSIFLYSIPIFVASFFSYALISLDVIIVKHYFSAHDAGTYTVLSTLSKIIFFAVAPIASVMFPIISKRKANNQNYKTVFRLSIMLSIFMVIGIVSIYSLVPSLVVGILYGFSRYEEAYYLLPWAGIFIGLYTLSSQIINYYLSLGLTKIVILVPITLIAQVVGFVFYHDSILSVILVSIVANGALLITLVGRLVYDKEI